MSEEDDGLEACPSVLSHRLSRVDARLTRLENSLSQLVSSPSFSSVQQDDLEQLEEHFRDETERTHSYFLSHLSQFDSLLDSLSQQLQEERSQRESAFSSLQNDMKCSVNRLRENTNLVLSRLIKSFDARVKELKERLDQEKHSKECVDKLRGMEENMDEKYLRCHTRLLVVEEEVEELGKKTEDFAQVKMMCGLLHKQGEMQAKALRQVQEEQNKLAKQLQALVQLVERNIASQRG